jgi:predicted dehydrogenase
MTNRLRIAVIGVGHLGQHHARLLASLDEVELVGIVDTKPGRAEQVAAKCGTRRGRRPVIYWAALMR